MPKIYFTDTGMRNQAMRNMEALHMRNDAGALAENAVEVKYQKMNRPRIPSGLRSFLAKYPAPTGIVITQDFSATLKNSDYLLHFIPAYLLN